MIKFSNVSKKYSDRFVLNNINLTLADKGLVAIVGHSGCGKTTLLQCLSGIKEHSGDITIFNQNLSCLSNQEKDDFRIKNIGFVFQDYRLFENMKVIDNILLPLNSISNSTSEEQR